MSAAITAWMLCSLLTGVVVCIAAIAASDAQRTARRPERWIWMGAIALIVALGALAPWRQSRAPAHTATAARVVAPAAVQGVAERASMAEQVAHALQRLAAPVETAMRMVRLAVAAVPARVHGTIVALWMLASALTLIAFAASYLRVRRRMAHWPARHIDGASVRVAPYAGPAVIGLMPAEIVVPQWLLARDGDEQRMVLAHEQEHVRANDPWLLAAACWALIMLPWHPALWFAFARLRFAIELDCDRRVLRRGVSPASYGALLIDLSALRSALPSAMPAFSCNGSYLERRLEVMTSLTSRLATPRRIAGGLLAAVALLAACETKLPTAVELESMDGAAVVQKAAPLVAGGAEATRYLVDGKVVPVEQARAIDAGAIASIDIRRAGQSEPAEVRIITRAASRAADEQAPADASPAAVANQAPTPTGAVVVRKAATATAARNAFEGLLVVDGTIVDASRLDAMVPDQIESVEVLKGQAAASAYTDPRAAKGVIRVTTKRKP